MNARLLFKASAIVEVLTGLALLVAPVFVIGLLLGDGLGPTGFAVARMLGIGLLSVGIAAWESKGQDTRLAQRVGLGIYNIGAAMALVVFAIYGGFTGVLLWPAAILHALLGAMMVWVIMNQRTVSN